MALAMKAACEECQTALPEAGEAFICSYECTFCTACTEAFSAFCPNCGGELLRRPRRAPEPEQAEGRKAQACSGSGARQETQARQEPGPQQHGPGLVRRKAWPSP